MEIKQRLNKVSFLQMFSESKDEIVLVLCGTQDTANDMADGES